MKPEGRIEKLNHYGEGTLSWQGHTIKLNRTAPGDMVRFKVPSTPPKHFIWGTVEQILTPSPHRVSPACKHFTEGCGGCQWLHISYNTQLQAKSGIVADLLERSGIRVTVLPTLGMSHPSAYRNKMSLVNQKGKMAFLKDHSTEPIFPVTCIQESIENQKVWEQIRELRLPAEVLQVHLRSAGGRVGINFFVKHYTPAVQELAIQFAKATSIISGVGASSYRDYRLLVGSAELEQELGGIRYRIPLNGFFQTNYQQALVLRQQALQQMELKPTHAVVDLYCGSGFFSLDIAPQVSKVIGIENSRDSIQAAIANAKLNKIENAHFVSDDAARGLSRLKPSDAHVMLVDPPRQGCSPEVLQAIARLSPQRIVYVSCSAESLARDLSNLSKSGYKIVHCQPVDMFPHTFHVEIVATLIKVSRSMFRSNTY